MAETGDKFVIEIGDKFTNEKGETLYRIKGFNSLVFDENGISKLTQHKTETEHEIKVGDKYRLKENGTRIVITKVDKVWENVSVLFDDGDVGCIDIPVLLEKYTTTIDANVSAELKSLFNDLPY